MPHVLYGWRCRQEKASNSFTNPSLESKIPRQPCRGDSTEGMIPMEARPGLKDLWDRAFWLPLIFQLLKANKETMEFQISCLSQTRVYRVPRLIRGQPTSSTKSTGFGHSAPSLEHHQLLFRPLHLGKYLGFWRQLGKAGKGCSSHQAIFSPSSHPCFKGIWPNLQAKQSPKRLGSPLEWKAPESLTWRILDAAHALSMPASHFFHLLNFQD